MKVETKTKKGDRVVLSIDGEWVHAQLHSSKFGIIEGNGKWDGNLKTEGMFLRNVMVAGKKSTICLQIPKVDYETVMNAIEQEAEAKNAIRREQYKKEALEKCPQGYVIARCLWSNGDLCAAEYETEKGVRVIASDATENINGWYFIPVEIVVEADRQAKEKEQKEEEMAEKETARVSEIKALATKTGKKQELNRELVECNDKHFECSTDIITTWAMPNGSITTTRTHTY